MDVEGQLHARFCVILYEVSVDFGISGGPGTNLPWIPRDDYS